jgi:ATP phosphoribosyltransferase regulatory subunit
MAATKLRDAPLPIRLCYAGKVYRQENEGGARRRETFQLGAELIGDASPQADVEILRLAIRVLHDLGIRDFQINVGDVRFVRPLLEELAPPAAERLREAIDRKDRATLAAHAREAGTSEAVQRVLTELPTLIGRSAVLLRAATVAADSGADEAIQSLQDCDALLTEQEKAHVVYDLGEVRGLGYYTGAQWEVFVAGVGKAVGFGGRYDGLLGLYGVDRPAVGFALETDALADALPV